MATTTDQAPRERAQILCDTAGSILAIRVRGEIDHHTAASIRQGIDGMLFEKRPRKLLLDLSAVSFMDSSWLGLIMGRYSVMKELEGEMVVRNPSPETRAIQTLAGMERMVRIEYPEGEAPTAAAATQPKRQASARRSAEGSSNMGGTSARRRKRSPAAVANTKSDRKEKDA